MEKDLIPSQLLYTSLAWAALVATGCAGRTHAPEQSAPSIRCPSEFAGTWHGMLSIHNAPGDPRQTIGFTLEIGDEPDDHGIPWRLTYEGQSTRDYRLKIIDAEKGEFLIDERNGITMPAHLLGDTLVSRFTVHGQTLMTRQRFRQDRIEHEVLAGSSDAKTRGAGVEGLRVTALQRATLTRQSPSACEK